MADEVKMVTVPLAGYIRLEQQRDNLRDEIERLTKLLAQIHDIAKNGLEGGDDYEAMRRIEELSGGD